MGSDEEDSVRRMVAAVKKVSDELQEAKKEKEDQNNIASHYGVKDEVFKKKIADMLADFFFFNDRSDVLDKHFPNLSAEDRLEVDAYASAHRVLHDVRGKH